MRVVIHDFGGYAFSSQLSRALADRGHEVLYLESEGFRPSRDPSHLARKGPPSLRSERISIGRQARRGVAPWRLSDERRYGKSLGQRIAQFEPNVVVSANCPLDAQVAAQVSANRAGAAFVFWLQDIYSDAVKRILGRRMRLAGSVIGARFEATERRLLRDSDAVVAITSDFLPRLRRWGVAAARTAVIENWAPIDEVRPGAKRNPWSEEHGLANRPVFLYAGTLGRKHNPALLLALAMGIPDAEVVVVSEGTSTEWLRRHSRRAANLQLLSFQPYERLSDVLASADVLVVLLEEDAGTFSVPSKVLTYLTAARAILGAMPPANLAARTIVAIGAGRVVTPSDADGFVRAARGLLDAPAERSRAAAAARAHALKAFDIQRITDRFEETLRAASAGAQRRHADASDTAWAPTAE
jgi:colanic acid biosynthesis glycosyl transferase WcaI